MTIDSLETVVITCIFIAPGFIVDGVVNAFCPNGKRNEAVYFLYCLIYSVVHCAICSWAYILAWKLEETHLIWFLILMCFIAVVGATVLGVIIGLFKSKQWLRKLIRKLRCNIDFFSRRQQ